MTTYDIPYGEFASRYETVFREMMSYELGTVGCNHYCTAMALLADDYPDYLEKFEEEIIECHTLN